MASSTVYVTVGPCMVRYEPVYLLWITNKEIVLLFLYEILFKHDFWKNFKSESNYSLFKMMLVEINLTVFLLK